MKAMLSRRPGGPETLQLEEIEDPRAGRGQVVIDVKACGVNYPDSLIINDKYQFKPQRPFAPGGEVSGTVAMVGAGVENFAVGDRVLASCGWGGMAEKVAVYAAAALKIPDAMPFEEAAAFMMTYGTSHHALKDRARLKAGETLLVLGAAGGVGIAAVELGKAMGAKVIGAVSTPAKAEFVKSKGADDVLIYPAGPFDRDGAKALAELFKQAVGKSGAHVIYDGVGGDYAEAALRAIAWEGRYLVVGFPAGIPKIPLNLALLKGCDIQGVFWGDFVRRFPERNLENIREMMAFYAAGQIKPIISECFSLEQAGEAIAFLAGRNALGKILVRVAAN